MSFAYPWWLLLVPVLGFLTLRPGPPPAGVRVAALLLWEHAGTGRARYLWVLRVLQFLTFTLLVLSMARPQAGSTKSLQVSEGVAIELLVDVSSSMDMAIRLPGGGKQTRMEVAKDLVEAFIAGDGANLPGRDGDLIGLITFARYPDTRSPLTFGHPALLQLVRDLHVQDRPNEDGTAYGDALALAAARLKHLDEIGPERSWSISGKVASRVIILLTDGENNSGNHLPLEAAGLARKWGCTVYCVSLGDHQSSSVDAPIVPLTPAEKVLEHIARETGGVFRKAFDYESLKSVYEEIDRLEQSEIATREFSSVSEWFGLPLALALATLLAMMVLESTWLRTAP